VFADLLRERIRPILELSTAQLDQLEQHYNLLIKWNRVLNLTRINQIEEVVERHYCESIFLGVNLPSGKLNIADLGSGAGFPGIPIAIVRPECAVSLIESHQRKSVFLREATRALRNIRVWCERFEDVSEGFDWVVCRAVRFSEVEKPATSIAPRIAILGTEKPSASCFTWNSPILLPWGQRRSLWIGARRST